MQHAVMEAHRPRHREDTHRNTSFHEVPFELHHSSAAALGQSYPFIPCDVLCVLPQALRAGQGVSVSIHPRGSQKWPSCVPRLQTPCPPTPPPGIATKKQIKHEPSVLWPGPLPAWCLANDLGGFSVGFVCSLNVASSEVRA